MIREAWTWPRNRDPDPGRVIRIKEAWTWSRKRDQIFWRFLELYKTSYSYFFFELFVGVLKLKNLEKITRGILSCHTTYLKFIPSMTNINQIGCVIICGNSSDTVLYRRDGDDNSDGFAVTKFDLISLWWLYNMKSATCKNSSLCFQIRLISINTRFQTKQRLKSWKIHVK